MKLTVDFSALLACVRQMDADSIETNFCIRPAQAEEASSQLPESDPHETSDAD